MTKTKETKIPPEWSYLIDSEDVDAKTQKFRIMADEEERKALARRLDVLSVDDVHADMSVVRNKGSMVVHVNGTLMARITQNCVVTMEPVESIIEEGFQGWFADPAQAVSFAKVRRDKLIEAGQGELPLLSEADDPEPIVDGQIDLGELVTQYLSLSIDPYPHAEGVQYEVSDDNETVKKENIRPNPFAALKDWKAKQGGGDA